MANGLQALVKEGIIEKFIPLDMSDAETVFDRCLAAVNKVKKVVIYIIKVLTISFVCY